MGQGVMRLAGITSPAMNINIVTNQLPVKVVVGAPGYYWIYLDEWIKERIIPWRNRKIRLLRNNHNTCQNIFFNDFKPELLHVANLFRIKAKRMISKQ
jgi:exosome complex RNA-binding protein Rrp4